MKNKDNKDIFRSLTLILQLGLTVIVPTLLLTFLGVFIDGKFGTYFTIPLCILGMAGGVTGAWNLIKRGNHLKDEKKEEYDLMAGWYQEDSKDKEE